ncbi:GPO family capsid scaffolding protein [Sphingomonas oryzagri]|uniref:GPO family capsid scaffolding protein n=1 Tax=Sphingomonas oryzagri TaxID=3042314 RepID=A0ABT6N7T0_9SPHN|nr:GPO family capsid scaffolding protein [Sphingomonas oryzagri]MDH7641183.1 GPO family capsid scaffolding protein [Sphingomonas oryzagri]
MAKSKPFRAFVEGNTISDGREITADMIDEIVETFDPETYTPRINIEHTSFTGYGDVVAVFAQDDQIRIAGKLEKRRALYATIEGNDQLLALVKADQKPFPSVEITDDYAGTGLTGLTGFAFTDNPASIATQRAMFSRAKATGALIAAGTDAVALEFEDAPVEDKATGAFAAFMTKLTGLLPSKEPEPKKAPKVEPKGDGTDFAAVMAEGFAAIGEQFSALQKSVSDPVAALTARFNKLEQDLANTEAAPTQRRKPSSGGTGRVAADF